MMFGAPLVAALERRLWRWWHAPEHGAGWTARRPGF